MRQSRNLTLGRAITALVVVFALVATTPTWIAPVPAQDGGGDGGGGSGGSEGGSGSSGGSGSNGGSGSGNSGDSGSDNSGGSGSGNSGDSGSGSSGGSGSGNIGGSGNSGSSSGNAKSGIGRSGKDNGYAASRGRGAYARRSGHQWGSTSADSARRAVKGGDAVPLGSVLRVVRAAVRGEVLEVDLRLAAAGEWRYELLVLDSAGHYLEVVVDARRNRILQIRRR